jgi:hypothetical protein
MSDATVEPLAVPGDGKPVRAPWTTVKSVAVAASVFTLAGTLIVHPGSVAHLVYYFCLWVGFAWLLHREDAGAFAFAFLVNSAFIAAFYLVQTSVYPESFGTTSPLGAQTDDSYFFSMVADSIPGDLEVRDSYFLYDHPFSTFIRRITVLSIDHPMDVIFFQSGIAAMLVTFSRRFMSLLSPDPRLARAVYVLALVCPFLMMNGGVIFIRDTFTAALFVYSLCCLASRRWVLALAALLLQVFVRPGTALIILPAYAIIFAPELWAFVWRHRRWVAAGLLVVTVSLVRFLQVTPDLVEAAIGWMGGTTEGGGLSFLGREVFEGLLANPGSNKVLLAIQEMPFLAKFVLNGVYLFLYPTLSVKEAFAGPNFDLRGVTLNLLVPIYAFWLNAWFIAGVLTRKRVTSRQVLVVVATVVSFLLIGTYSLQTRHKTTLYPLYYFVVAIGLVSPTPRARRIGYLCSAALLILQLATMSR